MAYRRSTSWNRDRDGDVVFSDTSSYSSSRCRQSNYGSSDQHLRQHVSRMAEESRKYQQKLNELKARLQRRNERLQRLRAQHEDTLSQFSELELTHNRLLSDFEIQSTYVREAEQRLSAKDTEISALHSQRLASATHVHFLDSQLESLRSENETLRSKSQVLEIENSLLRRGLPPNLLTSSSSTSAIETVDDDCTALFRFARKRKSARFGVVESEPTDDSTSRDVTMHEVAALGVRIGIETVLTSGRELVDYPFRPLKKRRVMDVERWDGGIPREMQQHQRRRQQRRPPHDESLMDVD